MSPRPQAGAVEIRREKVTLPTYEPGRPDKNPMFLEKRVYQGSSGRVYPLPFTDRVAEKPRAVAWDAVFIENEYILVMVLPALGGRIHRALDKTNGYDFIYHQGVIKPALVGLAGPWASGGIEFNWPQHHRPSTFMPADVATEEHPDGSKTVWLSEHDPMARMKGMHGVRLHPGRSYFEIVARVYNRTGDVQTFLWWANAAVRAHEQYQSFFPPDVAFVADHAKRAISSYPLCRGSYYGVDYEAQARRGVPRDEVPARYRPHGYPANDLSWYANIPVPTSYMCLGSAEDFAGGYDHRARAGIVHIADHRISPGKKQWTWGNSEFGYAWDRNLTDPDENGEYRPYLELMGGVYTDNQPDFSFLRPGETRTWSQFWYPIRGIGPAKKANTDAALSFGVRRGIAHIGISATARFKDARVRLLRKGRKAGEWIASLAPDRPLVFETAVEASATEREFTVQVLSQDGAQILCFAPGRVPRGAAPEAATEPPEPKDVPSCDELFLIGQHLEQYRHATRPPQAYWREALARDPSDSRCNLALGRWHLRRGELEASERHLRASIARLTGRNPNPYDGEAHYQLGRCLKVKALGAEPDEAALAGAYDALAKAAWSGAWKGAAFLAMAEIDSLRGNRAAALLLAEKSLRADADNLRAANLRAALLRRTGRPDEADAALAQTLRLDPLDWCARHLSGVPLDCDAQVLLDLALDYACAGLNEEALDVLSRGGRRPGRLPDATLGTAPLLSYYRAWIHARLGDRRSARRLLAAASAKSPDYCFPARLEEIAILGFAVDSNPADAGARLCLGNLLYDRRRHPEAIACWEAAAKIKPSCATAWRNLGIGYFNVLKRPAAASRAYNRALRAGPRDARVFYERDQLWKRMGLSPARRLRELQGRPAMVRSRDDLSVELSSLCNQMGRPAAALRVLRSRRFQPWEGGEGLALRQYARARILLGRAALDRRSPAEAARHFEAALSAPDNLGEAHHPLANQGEALYWLGRAQSEGGEPAAARRTWGKAAGARGDFQAMSVRSFSQSTYYSAISLVGLGRRPEARRLLQSLRRHAKILGRTRAKLDYFATSLPTMLLFEDDLAARQRTHATFLEAQALIGLGRKREGRGLLREVLKRDPSHAWAADQPTREPCA